MEVAEPWARQPPRLPVDLVLDIIARCDDDAKIVVRCGLVSKEVRHAMRGPGFHVRLGRRSGCGFDPGLLVAVSYRLSGCYTNLEGTVVRNDHVAVQPHAGRLPRFDTSPLATFDPAVFSRDGLIVFRDNEMLATGYALRQGLRVCDTIAGQIVSSSCLRRRAPAGATSPLPGTSIGLRASRVYQPALLSVHDDAVRSFELLVMCSKHDGRLLTQTFSSQEGEWGAALEVDIHDLPEGVQGLYEASTTGPAVVGRTVHWLCYTDPVTGYADRELIILAVDAESGRASAIKLPQELLIMRMWNPSSGRTSRWTKYEGRFMLAATATEEGERQLGVVAAETFAISLWTLVSGPDDKGSSILIWSRQEVIRMQEIERPPPLITGGRVLRANQAIRFCMFGERSGTVLFWMHTGHGNQAILVQLNLVTKKTLVLWRGADHCCDDTAHALLHETSLISVLNSF